MPDNQKQKGSPANPGGSGSPGGSGDFSEVAAKQIEVFFTKVVSMVQSVRGNPVKLFLAFFFAVGVALLVMTASIGECGSLIQTPEGVGNASGNIGKGTVVQAINQLKIEDITTKEGACFIVTDIHVTEELLEVSPITYSLPAGYPAEKLSFGSFLAAPLQTFLFVHQTPIRFKAPVHAFELKGSDPFADSVRVFFRTTAPFIVLFLLLLAFIVNKVAIHFTVRRREAYKRQNLRTLYRAKLLSYNKNQVRSWEQEWAMMQSIEDPVEYAAVARPRIHQMLNDVLAILGFEGEDSAARIANLNEDDVYCLNTLERMYDTVAGTSLASKRRKLLAAQEQEKPAKGARMMKRIDRYLHTRLKKFFRFFSVRMFRFSKKLNEQNNNENNSVAQPEPTTNTLVNEKRKVVQILTALGVLRKNVE